MMLLTSGVVHAAVIDFNTLPGSNFDRFTIYTENNFTVVATGGGWFKDFFRGNPAPAIEGSSPLVNTIAITDTGNFSFSSVDFLSIGTDSTYSIQGLLGGAVQFTQAGTQAQGNSAFTTLESTSPAIIDTLTIETTPGRPAVFEVDNIALNSPIPEPNTFALFAVAGAVGFQLLRKRRHARQVPIATFATTWRDCREG
ncbi:MAG: PEP-CTERM sorting domain-containing protein [Acidobacteriaceae bacterium]|nr:PEP-CTERM sorting domain-containing protein [Acidobacteriaceae bacterium]